jgi:peptide/nickel transport system permease protein
MALPIPEGSATTALPTLATAAPPPLPSLVSSRQLRMQRIGRSLRLWVPVSILLVIVFTAFIWPLVYTLPSPTNGNILDAGLPPFSPGHLLGTDPVGVDLFSYYIYGTQTSLEIAVGTTIIGMAIGCAIGVTAAFAGGWVDAVLSRVLDILIAFPALILVLVVSYALGPSKLHLTYALAFFSIPVFGRVSRGATLVLRSSPFMTAARLSGTRNWRIIARHIMPNILPGIISFSLLGLGLVIIIEGAIDFLGQGIEPPQPSLGQAIAQGQTTMTATPEYVLMPSIGLLILVIALNMFGDALRERWGVQ